MRSVIAFIFAAFLPSTLIADVSTSSASRAILAMGSYVPTDDMKGSVDFYSALFDSAPAISLPEFIAFNVAGGWFAIVSRERYAPHAKPGSGSVPYLQSSDLATLQSRVAGMSDGAPKIIREPGINLLKIRDPNGQLIEFFQLIDQ